MVRTKVEYVYPPEPLLAPVADPYREVKTTGEVIQSLEDYRGAFGICTAQLSGVREYVVKSKAALNTPAKPATK